MKFKLIFILFNCIILFSFGILYFMPLVMLGTDYAREVFSSNWYLPFVFLVLLALLNSYFIYNWKIFGYLESEDWEGLKSFVMDCFRKGKIRKQYVRILVNTSIASSSLDTIHEAEEILRIKEPALLEKNVLLFGIPYLLKGDPEAILNYFCGFVDIKGRERGWVLWNNAFALLLQGKFNEARVFLDKIPEETNETAILSLSGYIMSVYAESADKKMAEKSEEIKKTLTGKMSRRQWQRKIARGKENIQIAVLSKFMKDSEEWLFGSMEDMDDKKIG